MKRETTKSIFVKKNKEKLSYCKTMFGTIHEHNGYLECDKSEEIKNDAKTVC